MGFGLLLLSSFALRGFPALQNFLRDRFLQGGDEDESLSNPGYIGLVVCEAVIVWLLFSVLVPIWTRLLGQILERMLFPALNIVLPADSHLDMEACNDYRYLFDIIFDMTRFMFARAVLFALSNFEMFLLMVL